MPVEEPAKEGIAGRMIEARLQAGVIRRAYLSQPKMAKLVAGLIGRALTQTQWSRYENGAEPPLDVIRATAELSGLSAVYIAFGGTPETPPLSRNAQLTADLGARGQVPLTEKAGTPRGQELLQQTPAAKKAAGEKKGRGRRR